MFRNSDHFSPEKLATTYLRARGFDADGFRSGGIVAPRQVALLEGAVLVRFYQAAERPWGNWWITPNELAALRRHFAREGAAFACGRDEGKGILHATLAVLLGWSDLQRFMVVSLREPLLAMYGEGDEVCVANYSRVHKVSRIFDEHGRHRPVRQVFVPEAWSYSSCMVRLADGVTDHDLLGTLDQLRYQPLAFER